MIMAELVFVIRYIICTLFGTALGVGLGFVVYKFFLKGE